MMKIAGICFGAVLLLGVLSCSEDDPVTPPPPPVTIPMAEKDYVLKTLEQAYITRNVIEFEKLLDDEFTFFFGRWDIDYNALPVQWSRSDEMTATSNLFSATPPPPLERPRAIHLDINYPEGDNSWLPLPPDTVNFPGETLYEKTVDYSITLIIPQDPEDLTLTATNLQASFVVRFDSSRGIYRIVQWRDDIGSGSFIANPVAATEETTWGNIKSLYNGE